MRDAFLTFHGDNRSTEQEKQTNEFISREFCKIVSAGENHKYIISATIATDIVNKMGFDGIVYPSVQLAGQGGLNVALTPNCVNRKLKFIRTLDQTLYKFKDHSLIRIEKVYEGKKNFKVNQFSDAILNQQLGINDFHTLPLR